MINVIDKKSWDMYWRLMAGGYAVTLACADVPALKFDKVNEALQRLTHASTDPAKKAIGGDPALDETTFAENVQELLAILKPNDTTYEALSSVLTQVVGYEKKREQKLFPSYSNGTQLLETIRDSIADDGELLGWVFKRASHSGCLRRQGVWDYVDQAIKRPMGEDEGWELGGRSRQAIVQDVGFGATILMLGFVTQVAEQVGKAAEACQCKFVAVTDSSAPKPHSFIMCAILALGSAYYNVEKDTDRAFGVGRAF